MADYIEPLHTTAQEDYEDSPEKLHQRLLVAESKLCDIYRLIEMLKESNRTIWEHTIQCWDMKHEHEFNVYRQLPPREAEERVMGVYSNNPDLSERETAKRAGVCKTTAHKYINKNKRMSTSTETTVQKTLQIIDSSIEACDQVLNEIRHGENK